MWSDDYPHIHAPAHKQHTRPHTFVSCQFVNRISTEISFVAHSYIGILTVRFLPGCLPSLGGPVRTGAGRPSSVKTGAGRPSQVRTGANRKGIFSSDFTLLTYAQS